MPNDTDQVINYGSRDDVAPLMTAGLLARRRNLPMEMFTRYWRDVHGPLAARIKGFHQYWQHHLGAPEAGFWSVAGVDETVPDEYRIEGFAETTFRAAGDRESLGQDPAAQLLWHDEQNVFEATYLCPSATGDSKTLLDRFSNGAPQGSRSALTYAALLHRADAASQEALASFLRDRLAPAIAASADALKVRLHLLQPFDPSGWNTPGVRHDLPQHAQHHAILELSFRDTEARRRSFTSSPVRDVLAELPRAVGGAHTYPVLATYTSIYEGLPTLLGLKGLSVAETIVAANARNQTSSAVLQLLHGPDVDAPSALTFSGAN